MLISTLSNHTHKLNINWYHGSYVSTSNSTIPIQCAVGKTSVLGSSVCTDCFRGTYASQTGQSSCTSCIEGTFSTTLGAISNSTCVDCPRGKFGNITTAGTAGSMQLLPSSEILACSLCASGSYSTATGAKSISTCLPCDKGTFQSSSGASTCQTCPAGSYSWIGNSTCTLSPPGSFSPLHSSTSFDCPVGSFSSTAGSASK